MHRLIWDHWQRFFFAPAPPANLALCRVLFFGAFLLFYGRCDFAAWGEVSAAFWMPVHLFRWTALPPPAELVAAAALVWKGALALSCVGFLTRGSTCLAAVLGLFLLGLPHNFGKVHHSDAGVVMLLAVMALSRCGDAYSVDRWLQRRRQGAGDRAAPAGSGEYTWPVRLTWMLLALIYFAAGVSKLRHGGLAWITSDNLALILIRSNYHQADADPLTTWGLLIAQHGGLCRLLAAATVVIELGLPLALLGPPFRWVFVPALLGLLIGIRFLMGPTFEPAMLCLLFWVSWDRVAAHVLSWRPARPRVFRPAPLCRERGIG